MKSCASDPGVAPGARRKPNSAIAASPEIGKRKAGLSFAVEIARFRLLLAALRAGEVTRLAEAPDFRFSLAVGDSLLHGADIVAVFPYDQTFRLLDTLPPFASRHMWMDRTGIAQNKMFGGRSKVDCGLKWFEFGRLTANKLRTPLTITFGEVATHNHFVLDRGGKVFNRTAPVIKLPAVASEDDHLGLLGLLNSSAACFWLKQVCYPKGGDYVGQEGARVQKTKWDERYAFNGANVERFPLALEPPLDLARALDSEAQRIAANLPPAVCARTVPTRAVLDAAHTAAENSRASMIALQEELDWRCYRLYGLHDDPPEHPEPPPLHLGERAFEIVMARRMAAGELETAWFTRHRSTPITDLPAHWPASYRAVVERRIALIEHDTTIGLIERPEYKRRWASETWEDMERDALRAWLLDRLEGPRYRPTDTPQLTTVLGLADIARGDDDFRAVAALYTGNHTVRLDTLIGELLGRESVPFLAVLRYTESGLRKRADWEATWDKQRAEDAIDAACADPAEARRRKAEEIGAIPVPPKYKQVDYESGDYWRLRGGLDVPKERFVSYPFCARDADGSLPLLWAGHDHLGRARALAAWYVERKETDGWTAPRLAPMLAGLLELVPWLKQWHNHIDEETGVRMGDYFAEFIEEEARFFAVAPDKFRAWTPPAPVRKPRARKAALA